MRFSRGCFGCFGKDPVITAVDEPSKGLKIQGRPVKKSSISEDFWGTSTGEMDNSTIQSQRSISSISISNQSLDPSSSTSNPSEFVNHGLLLWNQTRQQWLANKRSERQTELRQPAISWKATYESLLGTNKPFPRSVPLPVSLLCLYIVFCLLITLNTIFFSFILPKFLHTVNEVQSDRKWWISLLMSGSKRAYMINRVQGITEKRKEIWKLFSSNSFVAMLLTVLYFYLLLLNHSTLLSLHSNL
ncbi:hypothetical protein SLEP1_g15602 [Rubroshorea leprosula]|uniref:Gag1-like clamp domain-containing protein n=1 Tax=Rubroshorea leprosula TaxID=152421 RepID=A0AAV5IS48_9ROSI|nr:hypothetical protein SLEP1_g15602 [Rubroshorea leprosula]